MERNTKHELELMGMDGNEWNMLHWIGILAFESKFVLKLLTTTITGTILFRWDGRPRHGKGGMCKMGQGHGESNKRRLVYEHVQCSMHVIV